MKKHKEYINVIKSIIDKIEAKSDDIIEAVAEVLCTTLINNKKIFLFGTGHSHMLAEELFYRAGGLVNIQPILIDDLMLHISASESTVKEREEGIAEKIFNEYKISSGDTIIIISNSGRNGVIIDMALLCKERDVHTVALTNLNHTYAGESRHISGKRLCEISDYVINNYGCIGDACLEINDIEGKICATSTVIGALLLNAVVGRAFELCVEKGFYPEHFASANIDGGDEINNKLVEKHKKEIKHL